MSQEIQIIGLPMPFRLGSVNCYLIRSGAGFILIDTGMEMQRSKLDGILESAGCRSGNLRLIVITHGDFDHTGNAAHLRQKFVSKIAMHPGDSGMAEHADMFWNRKSHNRLIAMVVPVVFHFTKEDRFAADIPLMEGDNFLDYGWNAKVVELPGHSKGSIGILTADGDLFCGDLFMNDKSTPALGFGDQADFLPSVAKVKNLGVKTIYPGHGQPFSSLQIP